MEKFKAFFKKHFTKKYTKCPRCKEEVDAYVKRCPHCYERMHPSVLPLKFERMLFLTDYKEFLLFIIGSIGFLFIGILINLGVQNFPFDDNLKLTLVNFISYIVTLAIIFCVLSFDVKEIITSFKNLLKDYKPIVMALIGLAVMIGFSYAYSAILNACGVTIKDNENQTALVNICKSWPGFAFFFIVLFGPISEEFTYRVGLFSILRKRNRYLAYIVSIIIFALIHFTFFNVD